MPPSGRKLTPGVRPDGTHSAPLAPYTQGHVAQARRKKMNWDTVSGKWHEFQGKVRSKWGKLTDDDLHVIGGKKDMLIGRLQQHYGLGRDHAEREVDDFLRTL
jgi:uncharacterized protein YjbJ (UPF0337 family)